MASTFHLFPGLPLELREQIWESAIRPARPGAHYFKLWYRPSNWDKYPEKLEFDPKTMFVKKPWFHTHGNEAEADGGLDNLKSTTRSISWTDSNPSAYLIDSGLWTACKESRRVMRRVFRVAGWQEHRKTKVIPESLTRPATRDFFTIPETGVFETDDESSPYRQLTTFPLTDMFIYQPDWGFNHYASKLLSSLYTRRVGCFPIPSIIAFELNYPDGGRQSSPAGTHGPVNTLSKTFLDEPSDAVLYWINAQSTKVCFIDYTASSKAPTAAPKDGVAPWVFCGSDCKFVEIEYTSYDLYRTSTKVNSSRLCKTLWRLFEERHPRPWRMYDTPFRVLKCVPI